MLPKRQRPPQQQQQQQQQYSPKPSPDLFPGVGEYAEEGLPREYFQPPQPRDPVEYRGEEQFVNPPRVPLIEIGRYDEPTKALSSWKKDELKAWLLHNASDRFNEMTIKGLLVGDLRAEVQRLKELQQQPPISESKEQPPISESKEQRDRFLILIDCRGGFPSFSSILKAEMGDTIQLYTGHNESLKEAIPDLARMIYEYRDKGYPGFEVESVHPTYKYLIDVFFAVGTVIKG